MPIRLAILGLDPQQREWLAAVDLLRAAGDIDLVAVAHRSQALAKDLADQFATARPPAFDDLRLLIQETAPQILLLDRPSNVGLEFLLTCITQKIGILSLGPPIENVPEAQALADILEPRSHLLYIWPRFAGAFAYQQCVQAEGFIQPIRFASAHWLGMNPALAKTASSANRAVSASGADIAIRSLSVLAWDALSTLIDLIGVPTSVYASIRGMVGSGATFTDISGACSATLRFPDDGVASLTLSDRIPGAGRRDLLLLGQGGTVKLETDAYEFRDADGKLIDSGRAGDSPLSGSPASAGGGPVETLREFLRHFEQAPSPARGWEHRLQDIAATMEALVVSHRTGQAESPERFRQLRR
jgi:predicted dehydrogenase